MFHHSAHAASLLNKTFLGQVVEDAAAEYLTYFAGKVIGMIRAPDEFIYPPPFNLIETFLVAPFE